MKMEFTIRRLEYTLKDHDVKADKELVVLLHHTMVGLRNVLTKKQEVWDEEDKKMEGCPCGDNSCSK